MNLIMNSDIQQMLEHFYRISGLRVGLHDEHMNIITEYPRKSTEYGGLRFCDRVRYHSPVYTERCYACDVAAYQHVCQTKQTYIYSCHAGFLEAIVPIIINDTILCCFMIGQVRGEHSPVDGQTAISRVTDEISSTPELEESFRAMPQIDLQTFTSLVYFLETCACYIYEHRSIRLREEELTERFRRYIRENMCAHIDRKQAADALNVSVSHLSRVIAQELGTTFTEYLHNVRINAAKDMLISTTNSVAEIAYSLAYDEPTYFMRIFKRITGVTCTEFRKECTKE